MEATVKCSRSTRSGVWLPTCWPRPSPGQDCTPVRGQMMVAAVQCSRHVLRSETKGKNGNLYEQNFLAPLPSSAIKVVQACRVPSYLSILLCSPAGEESSSPVPGAQESGHGGSGQGLHTQGGGARHQAGGPERKSQPHSQASVKITSEQRCEYCTESIDVHV